jgi:predicted acetyltransferase
VEIRDLTEDDLEQALDVRNRSFGPLNSGLLDIWHRGHRRSMEGRRSLAVIDGGRVVAMARIHDFRQWWLGRAVRMGGIGGVVVLPEVRGRGIGRALMIAILERCRELGFPTSALYPATVPIYRSIGYELAGAQRIATVPAEALRTLAGRGPYVDVRRPVPGDEQAVTDLISGLHERQRDAGPIEWRPIEWRDEIEDDEYFCYTAHDGFLGYGYEDGIDTLRVSHLVAGSEATLRSLWSLVGSGSSVTTTVKVALAPDDPLHWLLPERAIKPDKEIWWMLRLTDAAEAIAGRGFPVGAALDVSLRLRDPEIPANDGDWRLTVADGKATLARAETVAAASLELGQRGLAALYAGWPMHALRRGGIAHGGDPDEDARIDAAFGARAFMLDYF